MRGRRWTGVVAAIALLGSAVALAAPASAAPASDRYAIGDSVMLGALSALKGRGFRVDATESRQAYSGPALIRRAAGRLPQNVVVHLGTNGTFPLRTCRALVEAAGKDRRVFLVNVSVPRTWEDVNNAAIRQCDAAFAADRVHVIDWNSAVAAHPGWLYGDGIHLRPSGGAAFASLLDRSVDEAIATARSAALAGVSGSGTAGLDG